MNQEGKGPLAVEVDAGFAGVTMIARFSQNRFETRSTLILTFNEDEDIRMFVSASKEKTPELEALQLRRQSCLQ